MNLKLNHAVFASGRGTAMMQHCRYTPGLQLILQLSVRMVVGVVNRIVNRRVSCCHALSSGGKYS